MRVTAPPPAPGKNVHPLRSDAARRWEAGLAPARVTGVPGKSLRRQREKAALGLCYRTTQPESLSAPQRLRPSGNPLLQRRLGPSGSTFRSGTRCSEQPALCSHVPPSVVRTPNASPQAARLYAPRLHMQATSAGAGFVLFTKTFL